MFGTQDLAMFVAAGLLLNMTPGSDTLYIVGRSAWQGAKAGMVAALGIGAGCLVHIVTASAGLSTILAASATAFTIVKWVGAAYLFYLGVLMLRASVAPASSQQSIKLASLGVIFRQGFLTNVLNPKVALFFLAFLPQFIAHDAPSKWASMLFLGLLFNFNGTLWNLLVAWSSSKLTSRMKASPVVVRWLNRTAGGLFIWFGAKLVRSEN
jgi:threonine/homoserine/homoserine lactone efflux protein